MDQNDMIEDPNPISKNKYCLYFNGNNNMKISKLVINIKKNHILSITTKYLLAILDESFF
jgi:hypothetical protein